MYLNEQGLLKKEFGGAVADNEFIELPVDKRTLENQAIKNRIAIKALDYLENSNVIFIDAGSTLLSLTKLLVPIPHLAVITNSFKAVQELSDSGNTIYFIGGEVNSITQATSGFWSINELDTLKIDIIFLGTSGFQLHNGP
ncbi:MAG: hypothetical protein WC375_11575, partial [Methanomassiliicoccales archaeon]